MDRLDAPHPGLCRATPLMFDLYSPLMSALQEGAIVSTDHGSITPPRHRLPAGAQCDGVCIRGIEALASARVSA
jgi:hypothetical protein